MNRGCCNNSRCGLVEKYNVCSGSPINAYFTVSDGISMSYQIINPVSHKTVFPFVVYFRVLWHFPGNLIFRVNDDIFIRKSLSLFLENTIFDNKPKIYKTRYCKSPRRAQRVTFESYCNSYGTAEPYLKPSRKLTLEGFLRK